MSIKWGDYNFQGPYKLNTWEPPRKAGIYAIIHKTDPKNKPRSYTIDYFGESGDLSDRGFPWSHHRKSCFISRAGFKDNVYIATHFMPGSSEQDRQKVERALLKQYNPYCNRGMILTFYNFEGRPVAYTEDGMHIYLFSGDPVAYLYDMSIYSFSGKHLGWFKNGWIRDNYGQCVFFTEIATGGPIKPVKMIKLVKNIKQIKPIKSTKEMRPMRPMDSLSWSELSEEQFFEI